MHSVSQKIIRRPKALPSFSLLLALSFLTALPLPGAPTSTVNLSWNRNPEPNIARYEVSHRPVDGGTWSSSSVGTSTTAAITGLTTGAEYYFAVFAVNSAGLKSPSSAVLKHRITGQNRAPWARTLRRKTLKNTRKIITLKGKDADGDPLTYKILKYPRHGTLWGKRPVMTYLPKPGFVGHDRFTYRVSDGSKTSKVASVRIRVKKSIKTTTPPP